MNWRAMSRAKASDTNFPTPMRLKSNGGSASGWDVAEFFRTVRPDVPVVYTSGKSHDAERRVAGGVFVLKPYRHSDILEVCRRLAR